MSEHKVGELVFGSWNHQLGIIISVELLNLSYHVYWLQDDVTEIYSEWSIEELKDNLAVELIRLERDGET